MSEAFNGSGPDYRSRISLGFYDFLGDVWNRHMGSPKTLFETSSNTFYETFYRAYSVNQMAFLVALNQLYALKLVKPHNIFNKNGQIDSEATREEWETFASHDPLRSAHIAVIGGPEGRFFAELGAQVVSVDPYLSLLPQVPHLERRLREYPEYLTTELARKLGKGQFDLTLSVGLFDSGSGIEAEDSVMANILLMTRVGGISVHNGDMMERLSSERTNSTSVIEIAYYDADFKGANQSNFYVLQKK